MKKRQGFNPNLQKYTFTDNTISLRTNPFDTWEVTLGGADENMIIDSLKEALIDGATIFSVLGTWRGIKESTHIVKLYGVSPASLVWFLQELAERLPQEEEFMVQRLTNPTEFVKTTDLRGPK